MQTVELAVKQPFTLRLDERDFRVEFPISAVIGLEAKLGRSMRTAADWFRISPAEVQTVLAAGLARHHAEHAEEIAGTVCDNLGPEELDTVIEAVCASAFPRLTEKIREHLDKVRKGEIKNAPSGDGN